MIVKTMWPLVPGCSDITSRCWAPISVLAGTQCWAAAGGGQTSDTTPLSTPGLGTTGQWQYCWTHIHSNSHCCPSIERSSHSNSSETRVVLGPHVHCGLSCPDRGAGNKHCLIRQSLQCSSLLWGDSGSRFGLSNFPRNWDSFSFTTSRQQRLVAVVEGRMYKLCWESCSLSL